MELNSSEQNISELQEDNTVIYDESSSSENEENEGDSLPQESLVLDPVEEEEILDEACLPDIHNQVSFHDPYDHFLNTFEKGSRVFLSSMLQTERNFFKVSIMEQKEEIPLPLEIKEEGDQGFKSHIEDAVKNAEIKASQDKYSLPITEALK